MRPSRRGSALSEDRTPPSRALVVATMMLGTISTILSATIVNVAFPALIAEFHVGHDTLQWIAAGYLAAMTATMLGTAWLVETFGERATFVATLAIFLVASLLAAASWNTTTLIGARVLQGASAGILQPLAMIVLFRVYPVNERGRAMGIYGFGIVLAPAVGPAIGGTLLEAFGWRSIFLLTVPFCIAGLVLGTRTLATRRAAARARFDWLGAALLATALVALLNIPVVGHRDGFASPATVLLAAACIALAVTFVLWQRRAKAPLLPIRLFGHRTFVGASIVAFAYGMGLFGSTYLVPVFAQEIAHYDAAEAGYLLAPAGIALAIAISVGGRLTDRLHARPIVIAGLALFAVSSLLLTFSGAATGFVLLALWLVIGRVGLGMLIPALNVGAVQSLGGTELAYASAAVNFVRQLGGAVGVNLLAVVLEWRLDTVGRVDPAKPFHECFAIVTLAFALAIIPAWLIRPNPGKTKEQAGSGAKGGNHVSEDSGGIRRLAGKPPRRR